MKKEIVLSGIRPTGSLHLGNYFGAIMSIFGIAKSRSKLLLFCGGSTRFNEYFLKTKNLHDRRKQNTKDTTEY